MDPDLFKAFYEEFYREINRLRTAEYGSAEAKRSELDRVERRIRRIIELITEDDAPVRALKQELVTLEARQLTLQQELAATEAPAPLIHPNLAEVYRQRVERLHDALRDPATRGEALELSKQPDGLSAAELAEQIKVVAGAGSGLCDMFNAQGLEARLSARE
jgi:site-specific DNA recombinase